jgi:tRNA threonylcarbamoyladenosine biosynthesis protein TsaB
MPMVEKVLEFANVDKSEIDCFSAVTGPGSFTGIRIGVSTAKAFSYAFNKPVLPVTSFDVLAYNSGDGKRLAVIDAMHDNFYVAGYDGNEVILKPQFVDINKLKELSLTYKILSATQIDGVESNIINLKTGLINALNVLKGKETNDREELIPLYVRKSQAEESL